VLQRRRLLRLRAHACTDPNARRADLAAALTLPRRQGAALFQLRAALDDFEFCGELARTALVDAVNLMPGRHRENGLHQYLTKLAGQNTPSPSLAATVRPFGAQAFRAHGTALSGGVARAGLPDR